MAAGFPQHRYPRGGQAWQPAAKSFQLRFFLKARNRPATMPRLPGKEATPPGGLARQDEAAVTAGRVPAYCAMKRVPHNMRDAHARTPAILGQSGTTAVAGSGTGERGKRCRQAVAAARMTSITRRAEALKFESTTSKIRSDAHVGEKSTTTGCYARKALRLDHHLDRPTSSLKKRPPPAPGTTAVFCVGGRQAQSLVG